MMHKRMLQLSLLIAWSASLVGCAHVDAPAPMDMGTHILVYPVSRPRSMTETEPGSLRLEDFAEPNPHGFVGHLERALIACLSDPVREVVPPQELRGIQHRMAQEIVASGSGRGLDGRAKDIIEEYAFLELLEAHPYVDTLIRTEWIRATAVYDGVYAQWDGTSQVVGPETKGFFEQLSFLPKSVEALSVQISVVTRSGRVRFAGRAAVVPLAQVATNGTLTSVPVEALEADPNLIQTAVRSALKDLCATPNLGVGAS